LIGEKLELHESFPVNNSLLTMDLYDDLASNEEGCRIKAAEELVTKIVEGQKSGNAEKGTDLTYALTRLVKGLSSGRESARLGFGIALTEVRPLKVILT
jgi:DNA polymerase phi